LLIFKRRCPSIRGKISDQLIISGNNNFIVADNAALVSAAIVTGLTGANNKVIISGNSDSFVAGGDSTFGAFTIALEGSGDQIIISGNNNSIGANGMAQSAGILAEGSGESVIISGSGSTINATTLALFSSSFSTGIRVSQADSRVDISNTTFNIRDNGGFEAEGIDTNFGSSDQLKVNNSTFNVSSASGNAYGIAAQGISDAYKNVLLNNSNNSFSGMPSGNEVVNSFVFDLPENITEELGIDSLRGVY
jgi:hypothetical protein